MDGETQNVKQVCNVNAFLLLQSILIRPRVPKKRRRVYAASSASGMKKKQLAKILSSVTVLAQRTRERKIDPKLRSPSGDCGSAGDVRRVELSRRVHRRARASRERDRFVLPVRAHARGPGTVRRSTAVRCRTLLEQSGIPGADHRRSQRPGRARVPARVRRVGSRQACVGALGLGDDWCWGAATLIYGSWQIPPPRKSVCCRRDRWDRNY